jgi:hypothetical protein
MRRPRNTEEIAQLGHLLAAFYIAFRELADSDVDLALFACDVICDEYRASVRGK